VKERERRTPTTTTNTAQRSFFLQGPFFLEGLRVVFRKGKGAKRRRDSREDDERSEEPEES
jgi:hypothetical protein